jgi:hypothetical protein
MPPTASPPVEPPSLSAAPPCGHIERFESAFLEDIADIIASEDPSSEGVAVPPEPNPIDLMPLTWLQPNPDNPFFAPAENYVTVEHVRMASELCALIGVPVVTAPEEAAAECARLENAGLVDAVASDDNNTILFGSKWLVRNVFLKPQSITIRSLDAIGITADRLLMLAMMIDGDYNSDIRRRLFTVGPVRGMEIIGHFPNPHTGLLEFKEWWIRVVKAKQPELNPERQKLSKKKWLKRLILPGDFPPEDLIAAFKHPVVGTAAPEIKPIVIDEEKVIYFVTTSSAARHERVAEFCRDFAKRSRTFGSNRIGLMRYQINPIKESSSFAGQFAMIAKWDREQRGSAEVVEGEEEKIRRILDADTDSEESRRPSATTSEEDSVGTDSVTSEFDDV